MTSRESLILWAVDPTQDPSDASRISYHHNEAKWSHHVSVFGRTLQKSELWISEVHRELHWVDTATVYRLLRAVLHTIRDQMSTDEVAHYAARLPLLLRRTFFEYWNPSERHHRLSDREFLHAVARIKRTFHCWRLGAQSASERSPRHFYLAHGLL